MPKISKPGDIWYLRLTKEEAQEIATLETILESLKAALHAASVRRGVLRMRATMRKVPQAVDQA